MTLSRSLSVRPAAELAAAGCRLIVVVPWVHLAATSLGDNALPGLYWRLGLVAALSYLATRTLHRRVGRVRAPHAVLHGALGALLAAALLALPAAGLGLNWPLWLAAGMLAWMFAAMISAFSPDAGAMHAHMIYGALGLTASILLASHMGLWEETSATILPITALWLIAVVVATALSRFAELSDRYTGIPVTRFWPPVLGAIGLICLMLALFFGLAAPLVLEALKAPAAIIFRLASYVLLVFAYGVGMVVQIAVWLLRFLISPGEWDLEPPAIDTGPGFPDVPPERVLALPPEVLRWLLTGAVVAAGIGLTVYLLLRFRAVSPEQAADEQRESFASLEAMGSWARRRWWGLLRAARERAALLGGVKGTATDYYRAVLALSARKGESRRPATTPVRHQPAVHRCFPEATDEADAILDAFSSEYYGGNATDAALLEDLSRSLARIRGKGQPPSV